MNNDGEYEFTLLTSNNKAGYDSYAYGAAVTTRDKDNTIGGVIVDDDAVIVLYAATDDTVISNANPSASLSSSTVSASATAVKVISGKEFKSINNDASGATKYYRFDDDNAATALIGRDSDGFNRVRVASVAVIANANTSSNIYGYDTTSSVKDWNLGVFTGSNYGYLVTSSWTENVDGTAYNVFKFWNGSEVITMREKDSVDAKLPARTVIAYDVVDDQTIKNVTTSGITTGAVQAYSSSASKVTLGGSSPSSGTEYKITNQTVILNINDADKTGVEGNSIALASSINYPGTDTVAAYIENCYYRTSGDEVDVIVIDVNKNTLNSVTGLATVEGSLNLTDGVGINNSTMKIGVPAATSLAAGNITNVQTHVMGLFSNAVTVTIGTSGGNCATAVVTGPDGVGVTYSLVVAFDASAKLASLGVSADSLTNLASAQSVADATLTAAHAASVTVTLKTDANTNGNPDAGDVVTVTYIALNGDVITAYDITVGA